MKKKLNSSAKEIAKHGRFGDDRLLHVSQTELDGLATLIPGGKLPTNPDTGLPEAFFFLPFLAALGGAAAAPAAAAAGTTAALTAAAAPTIAATAAPLAATAGTTAAAGGLGALGAGTTAGLTGAAMPALTAGGATALAPTAVTGAAGLPAALAGTPLAGGTAASALAPTAASALPTATSTLGAAGAANPVAAASGIGSGVVPGAGTAATMADGLAAAGVGPGSTAAGAAKGGLGSLLGGIDGGKLLQYGALGSMLLPRGGGGGGGKEKSKSPREVGAKDFDRGEQVAPEDGGVNGGITNEWNYFPNRKYYAKGGLAALDKSSSAGSDDEQLIDATIAAIQGQTPNAQQIIQTFVQEFGPEALQDLVQQVQGQQGQSDGLSDSIPAQIQGLGGLSQPAQLSEGEYVVPSDVVSHLGNGSSSAGERQLNDMVSRTRAARGAQAPVAIDPSQVMPA